MSLRRRASAAAVAWIAAGGAQAQTSPPPEEATLPTVNVVGVTPLSGVGIDVDKTPSAVTVIDETQIRRAGSPNVTDSLAEQAPAVSIGEASGNAFQPDVSVRGFDASPVAGTPEGIAVYQNGVRVNEAFGDLVNWDFIPTTAIRSMDMVANNPAFGFNALGGALSVQMKDGFSNPGGSVDVSGGSFGRVQSSFEYGKQVGNWAIYGALEGAHEDGFRQESPSMIRRFWGDLGYRSEAAEFHINVGLASNTFGATGTVPIQLLQQSWSAVYTTPQTSVNDLGLLAVNGRVDLSKTWTLQGEAHVRSFFESTVDGNSTNAQPCSDPTLLCFNSAVAPANGLNGQQLPNTFSPTAVLGEIDRTKTETTTIGGSLQATNTDPIGKMPNQFTVGAALDRSVTHFGASAELGVVQPNYVVLGSGIFLGPSGSPVSDGPVNLVDTNYAAGVYALDSLDVTDKLTATAAARLNVAEIELNDLLGGGVTGDDLFWRVNPMLGATYKLSPEVTVYGSYAEANRAPTPLELGCANPAEPCILASFLVSDPPLKQVVARTFEAGFRGSHEFGGGGALDWRIGAFHTRDSDDILNVASPLQQGFGYFTNVGPTLRQGIEAQATYRREGFKVFASYAFVDARFLSNLTLASNSPSADVNGLIYVQPGDEMPLIPRHRLKLGVDWDATSRLSLGADALFLSSERFSGDESNQQKPLPGYWTIGLDASYKVTDNVEFYGRVENLLDARYYTYGTYFDTTSLFGTLTDPRSVTPGGPRAFYAGMRATF